MNSNGKTVLISVVGVIAAIGLMVGAGFGIARAARDGVRELARGSDGRTVVVQQGDSPAADQPGSPVTGLAYTFRDFDTVRTAGGWSVSITGGDGYSVEVTAAERVLEDVKVFTRGNVLHLVLDSGVRSVTGNLTASITMPDLERLETDGGADVTLTGLDLDALEIDVDGAASIRAGQTRIGSLSIQTDGAASLDLSGAQVVNARLDMDGASRLDITMAGGSLAGTVRGLGEVSYGGAVSSESVDVDGLGRVRRR